MNLEALAELDLPRPAAPVLDESVARFLGQMARAVFAIAAGACALAAALLGFAVSQGAPLLPLAGAFALLAALAALGMRRPQAARAQGLTALLLGITLAVALTNMASGAGMAAPGLSLLGLLVFASSAVAGWRAGLLLAVVAAAAVLAIYLDGSSTNASARASGAATLAQVQLGVHLLLIAVAAVGGGLMFGFIKKSVGAAAASGQHFRGLLALAADAYWELDHEYRLVAVSYRGDKVRRLTPETGLGAVPWEMDGFGCDAEALDLVLADLDSRLPFRDLSMQWRLGDGRLRRLLVSGEPRFSERGIFTGYRGVTRDVSDDIAARAALAATEKRYQELFTRTPSALILHRGGHVIDANEAALSLFGYAAVDDMLGSDLLSHYEGGASLLRARQRLDDLQTRPVGASLPVADFRLLVRGRQVLVRATGVRVDADGGPAVLSIFVDDTERRAAEEAVRRSEAMLSHLVATSPDLITVTEMASGRYAMVNHAFERLIGYTAAQAVGKTSTELGVWRTPADRETFIERMKRDGSVSDLPIHFGTQGGGSVSLLVSAARFVMDRRDYVVINARDVTESERLRLEREAILTNASVGIAVTRDRRFVLANRCFEDMFGWDPNQLVGQPGQVVWGSDANYAEVAAQMGPNLARGELAVCERSGQRRDGSRFLARVLGRAIDPANPIDGGTVWIVEDVTERREFEQDLARARDEAEAASRAKSAFLANTSHELRTPLNGMIGMAQLARLPDIDDAQRRQYLDQIAESAQSLAGVISDILDLSKIEAGQLQVENTAFDLGELLRSLHRTYTVQAQSHRLELLLDLQSDADGTVFGDPLRVRQIVTNFLSNAIKFTERGGVTLAARRDGDRVRLEVRDTGLGIDQATQARLFKPFTQADESTTRRYGGTGLGLSICRELATLMAGEVGVQSRPGEGSLFWTRLPLPVATPEAAPQAEAKWHEDPQALAGTHVLMVEDNPVNMMIAVAVLKRWGIDVAQAQDGQEALLAVSQAAQAGRPFDAVLMDVQMPVMSGHEATRELRRSEAGRELPIIALTAAALVTERDEAFKAGMNDFLTKPIDLDKLRQTLLRWTRERA